MKERERGALANWPRRAVAGLRCWGRPSDKRHRDAGCVCVRVMSRCIDRTRDLGCHPRNHGVSDYCYQCIRTMASQRPCTRASKFRTRLTLNRQPNTHSPCEHRETGMSLPVTKPVDTAAPALAHGPPDVFRRRRCLVVLLSCSLPVSLSPCLLVALFTTASVWGERRRGSQRGGEPDGRQPERGDGVTVGRRRFSLSCTTLPGRA